MNRSQRRANKKLQPAPSRTANPQLQQVFDQALWHHQAGHLAQAEQLYRHVLANEPRHVESLHRLGMIALQVGQEDGAIQLIGQAIALNGKVALYHFNLGSALKSKGALDAAVTAYRKAIALQPDYILALSNLGTALQEQGLLDEASHCFHKVLKLEPDNSAAHNNLGNALKDLGQAAEAVACFRRSFELDPSWLMAASNIAITVPLIAEYSAEEAFVATKEAGALFDAAFSQQRATAAYSNSPAPERPLRIGYLSPSLQKHVLAGNLEPLFRGHHRDQFSVYVYAHVPHPDAVTQRLMGLADHWTDVHDLSDNAVAHKIRADGIDILINPIGHWLDNRLPVFARKPAPIQVNYLIQGLTTGLDAIDYAIGDRWMNFDGAMQTCATENVVELPSGFQVTSFAQEWPIHHESATEEGAITFASFNNPTKLSNATLELWAAVLARVPGSKMLVKGLMLDRPYNRSRLLTRMAEHGIAPERVELVGFLSDDGHMDLHNRVDIMLDTIPFAGGRTTEDALWMGVPVVTLIGETVCGRIGYSHLSRIGVPELAARTKAEYVEIAADLAGDFARRKQYRQTLRKAFAASSLLDVNTHVTELEDAFRIMWRRWCAGDPPAPFSVEPH